MARSEGFDCYALSFDYGQRHTAELVAAERLAGELGATEHRVMRIDFAGIGGSALTDERIDVPESGGTGIPVTYVPARNTVFLSLGLAWAEVLGASDIFIGVNAVDYSGYPDCRPEYIRAFETMSNLATRAGVEGGTLHIRTPLMNLSKADIVRAGTALKVPYAATVSCYQANDAGEACGRCDACYLRQQGFVQAELPDPTLYY